MLLISKIEKSEVHIYGTTFVNASIVSVWPLQTVHYTVNIYHLRALL